MSHLSPSSFLADLTVSRARSSPSMDSAEPRPNHNNIANPSDNRVTSQAQTMSNNKNTNNNVHLSFMDRRRFRQHQNTMAAALTAFAQDFGHLTEDQWLQTIASMSTSFTGVTRVRFEPAAGQEGRVGRDYFQQLAEDMGVGHEPAEDNGSPAQQPGVQEVTGLGVTQPSSSSDSSFPDYEREGDLSSLPDYESEDCLSPSARREQRFRQEMAKPNVREWGIPVAKRLARQPTHTPEWVHVAAEKFWTGESLLGAIPYERPIRERVGLPPSTPEYEPIGSPIGNPWYPPSTPESLRARLEAGADIYHQRLREKKERRRQRRERRRRHRHQEREPRRQEAEAQQSLSELPNNDDANVLVVEFNRGPSLSPPAEEIRVGDDEEVAVDLVPTIQAEMEEKVKTEAETGNSDAGVRAAATSPVHPPRYNLRPRIKRKSLDEQEGGRSAKKVKR
ncbi:hypothetical protein K490DRAFT_60247 [Saccharata proteae CBS 121410]|uniref:Uncharacterized protein n=1 Tax=Saccharata proteae CBS 121410 TaxID=1314787 RepID=A0A9P4HLB9_9PEZI|nr:hypothetical protein K490DRAFT_60247 [Saccharata proteae CBS 121410]